MTAWDAVVLMGPPGSGKSFLGNHLAAEGIVEYRELEPLLRREFGAREAFLERKHAAGAFIARSYREQLAGARLPVAIESTGISDRPILEPLLREHPVAIAHLHADRALCVERVVTRPTGRNISDTDDRERVGAFYDYWTREIAPGWSFDLTLDGSDVELASQQLRAFLS